MARLTPTETIDNTHDASTVYLLQQELHHSEFTEGY